MRLHLITCLLFMLGKIEWVQGRLSAEEAQDQSTLLGHKWGISLPEVDYSSGWKFLIQWQTSNFVQDDMVTIQVLDPIECAEPLEFGQTLTPGEIFWGPPFFSSFGDDHDDIGAGDRKYIQELSINPYALLDTPPPIFKNNYPSYGRAQIEFCTRFSLTWKGKLINWMDAQIRLYVYLRDTIDVESVQDFDIEIKQFIVETDFQTVEGAFCEGQPPRFLTQAEIEARTAQGLELQVCVKPTPRSVDYGLTMRRIDYFYWSREDPVTGGEVKQYCVKDNKPADALTRVYCPGDGSVDTCTVETLLVADFYSLLVPAPTFAPTPQGYIAPPTDPPLQDIVIGPPSFDVPDSFIIPLFAGEASSDADASPNAESRRDLSVADVADGKTYSFWTAEESDSTPWIQFDMNGYQVVTSIEIQWKDQFCAKDYKILLSTNKIDWDVLRDISSPSANNDRVDIEDIPIPGYDESCYQLWNLENGEPPEIECDYDLGVFGRFIRIEMETPCVAGSTFSIREISVWGHEVGDSYPINVPGYSLTMKAATASSTWVEGFSGPENAIDSNNEVFWRSEGPSAGEYLTVEMENFVEVSQVQIQWYGLFIPDSIEIGSSIDGALFSGGDMEFAINSGKKNLFTTLTRSDLDMMNLEKTAKYIRIYGRSGEREMGIRSVAIEGVITAPLREEVPLIGAPEAIVDGDATTGFLLDTPIGEDIYGLVFTLPGWYTIVNCDVVVETPSTTGAYASVRYSDDGVSFALGDPMENREDGDYTIYSQGRDTETKYIRIVCHGEPCMLMEVTALGYATIPAPLMLNLADANQESNTVDGDPDTTWISEPGTYQPYLLFDLGSRGHIVRHSNIKFRGDRYCITYHIQASKDAFEWMNIMTHYEPLREDVSPQYHERYNGNFECRFIRFFCEEKGDLDSIEVEEIYLEGFLARFLPEVIDEETIQGREFSSLANPGDTPFQDGSPWTTSAGEDVSVYRVQFYEETDFLYGGLTSVNREYLPHVITAFEVTPSEGFAPAEYALEVSRDSSDDASGINWIRVATVSPGPGASGPIKTSIDYENLDLDFPVWATTVRLVLLEHGGGQDVYKIESVRFWGYDGNGSGFSTRRRLDEMDAMLLSPAEEDDEAWRERVRRETREAAHRYLQDDEGPTIQGQGQATLQFNNQIRRKERKLRRVLTAEEERQHRLKQVALTPKGEEEEDPFLDEVDLDNGDSFGLQLTLRRAKPDDGSGATVRMLGQTIATAIGMALVAVLGI